MKLDLNTVTNAIDTAIATAVDGNNMDPVVAAKVKNNILQNIRAIVEEEAKDAEESGDSAPRQKNQLVVVISDPNGEIKTDHVAWVVEMPEDESVSTVLDRVHAACYEYNTSKKGRLQPIKQIGEGFENVSRKFFKERDLKIKTKTPVWVAVTDNQLPKDNSSKVS